MNKTRRARDSKRAKPTLFPLYLGLIGILMSGRPFEAERQTQPDTLATPPAVVNTVQPDDLAAEHTALLDPSLPLPVAQAYNVSNPRSQNGIHVVKDMQSGSGMKVVSDKLTIENGQEPSMVVVEESLALEPQHSSAALPLLADDIVFAEVGSQQAITESLDTGNMPANILLVEPAGCQRPIDDFNRIMVRDKMLNRRTYAMLQYADTLYGGVLDITDTGIIQGSYESRGLEGDDIYRGGGVLDLSVSLYGSSTILYGEVEPLVKALRVAGFAAWFREEGEVAPDSPAHIHAVAIGDSRLTRAAAEQINGPAGYFRGYTGLVAEDGTVTKDRYNGPVVCQWMVDDGYIDSTTSKVVLYNEPVSDDHWQQRLKEVAERYITDNMSDSITVARHIDFIKGDVEHPANMCGPLAASILNDAGLLPNDMPPAYDMHNYWLANPRQSDRPFSLFPDWEYEKYRFYESVSVFDFVEFPLMPADFIYTYAVSSGFDHMFVVTEVDEAGRAYTVTNQMQEDHTYLVERILLYDPNDATVGALKDDWVNNGELGKTGLGGFAVIRRKGSSLPSGSRFEYSVQAGDTILSVASRFNSETDDIIMTSNLVDVRSLPVGQSLLVPVNLASSGANNNEPRRISDVLTLTGGRQSAQIVRDESQPMDTSGDAPNIITGDAVMLMNPPDVSVTDMERTLNRSINDLYEQIPSGDWGIYIEDLNSGMVISAGDDIIYHPASTIKVAVGAAFMHWMDDNPSVKLSNGPVMNQRSYEQLLRAMLIKSEEEATTILIDFLNRFEGYEVQTRIDEWGLQDTTIQPRRTRPSDMALLLKKLYRGELVSEGSTRLLLELLKTPSNHDDVRLGAGIPEYLRTSLAHKPGTVFDDGWGVVSDVGVFSSGGHDYIMVVLSNFVEWIDYDEAQTFIADVSQAVYDYQTGSGGVKNLIAMQELENETLGDRIARELQAARPQKPDAAGLRPSSIEALQNIEQDTGWSLCQPEDGSAPDSCSVKVAFQMQL